MTAIHQVAAGAAPRDAITNHLLAARERFREWGYESEIFAAAISPALSGEVHDARRYPRLADRDALAILHLSIQSPAFAIAAGHARRSAVHYHNITPADLLWRFAPAVALECAVGRRRLGDFAGRVAGACADSRYNADELAAAGYADPVAVGILRRPGAPLAHADRGDRPPRLLFVGRGIPNKAQHHLILATAALHETGTPAELRLVGSWDAAPGYRDACVTLARGLGIAGSVRLLGSVDDMALREEYARADCFVCLSDHEGYCVPVVEALEAGLPIVAYGAGAVPETVGDAGIVTDDKRPSTVAEAVLEVLSNAPLREAMRGRARDRLADLGPETVGARLRGFVEGIVGG